MLCGTTDRSHRKQAPLGKDSMRGSAACLVLGICLVVAAAAVEGDKAVSNGDAHGGSLLEREEQQAATAERKMLDDDEEVKTDADAMAEATRDAIKDRDRFDLVTRRDQMLRRKMKKIGELVERDRRKRDKSSVALAHVENAERRAGKITEAARRLEEASHKARFTSELKEGEGNAIQQPSQALITDSRRLNDQSNLVLEQSRSPHAKALAALDLKMAQSLADKATAGMNKAKKLFATAISERKVAVEDDEEAAADAVRAARVSERGGADEGSLSGVISGRVTGAKAMRVVAGAAGKAVGDAERQLGKASQAVKSEEEQRIQVAHEIGRIAGKLDALKAKLSRAQAEVLSSAKQHLSAVERLKRATAAHLAAEARVDEISEGQKGQLHSEVEDARRRQLESATSLEKAQDKINAMRGERTKLEVQVASLKDRLGQEEKEREKAISDGQRAETKVKKLEADGISRSRGRHAEFLDGSGLGGDFSRSDRSTRGGRGSHDDDDDDDDGDGDGDGGGEEGGEGGDLEEEIQREDKTQRGEESEEEKREAREAREEKELEGEQAKARAEMGKVAAMIGKGGGSK